MIRSAAFRKPHVGRSPSYPTRKVCWDHSRLRFAAWKLWPLPWQTGCPLSREVRICHVFGGPILSLSSSFDGYCIDSATDSASSGVTRQDVLMSPFRIVTKSFSYTAAFGISTRAADTHMFLKRDGNFGWRNSSETALATPGTWRERRPWGGEALSSGNAKRRIWPPWKPASVAFWGRQDCCPERLLDLVRQPSFRHSEASESTRFFDTHR